MKRVFLRIALLVVLLAGLQVASQAQRYIVKVRPSETVIVTRPPAPSPRHIWIEGEWVWRNGGYVREPGRWMLPRRGFVWVPGHWRSAPRGWYWIRGHWRRAR